MSENKKFSVIVTQDTSWVRALNACRRTVGKEPMPCDYEPSERWKVDTIMDEHSPIKLVEYCIAFSQLRQWVGVHFLRHEHTIPQIHTQRNDRRDLLEEYPYIKHELDTLEEEVKNDPDFNPRDLLHQGELNDQDFYVNAQTLINISRRRLCNTASKETVQAWRAVKDAIAEFDPVMASFMVPNCIYRGFCPSGKRCCGFVKTKKYYKELKDYRRGFPENELTLEDDGKDN